MLISFFNRNLLKPGAAVRFKNQLSRVILVLGIDEANETSSSVRLCLDDGSGIQRFRYYSKGDLLIMRANYASIMKEKYGNIFQDELLT